MSAINPISVTKQTIAISGKNFLDFSKSLRVGDVLQGRVLSVLGDGKYGIHFRGHNVVAESTNRFETGQIIQGQVKDLGSKVVMRLVDSNTLVGVMPKQEFIKSFNQISISPSLGSLYSSSMGLLQGLSSQGGSLSDLAIQLLAIFDPKHFKQSSGKGLDAFVRNIFSKETAAKVGSLSSKLRFLLEQDKHSSGIDAKQLDKLKNFLDAIVKNLEAQGHINKNVNEEGLYAYMQLPFVVGEQANRLELKLFDESEGKGEKSRLCLNLDFELKNLGALLFNIHISDNDLEIKVFSETEAVNNLIKASSKSLLESIEAMGYKVSAFKAYLFESDVANQQGLNSKLDFFSVRRIDTVA